MNRAFVLCLVVLFGELAGGCSTGAHSAASRTSEPIYLAQSAVVDCRNSMECCIKKFPTSAAESCGATAAEIAEILNGAKVLHEASETATLKGVDVPERGEERDDGEERPDWREHCIEQYTRCIDLKWTGNCSSCLARCMGQRGLWPEDMCGVPKPRRSR
ncbi:hypothetical protein [Hyalangium rubrum]|uniref:Lipoprotein n=1 Tax=Hyalangium rubrum TaxID=3103134 RepID=A0ABU5GYW6_9BACT|nr:hypothetical protein [Hyalangium sp. s54d21]MDY7226074.1 hypothetical protein [Hyalangium sp. s54d21]